jgi:biopolymer transport protein ExbB
MNKLAVLVLLGAMCVTVTAAYAQAPAAGTTAKEHSVFEQYFWDGGWVVIGIEFPMSIAMVALTIMFGIEVRRGAQMPEASIATIRGLLEARQYRETIEYTATDRSMVSFVIHTAMKEASRGYPAMERAMEDAIDERVVKFMRKIEFLNVFGNLGPMIGLFGTVLGMILTFNEIAKSGNPTASQLAGGIGVALICTLWGLFIALPALTAFAVLRNRIEATSSEVAFRSQELLNMFNPAAMRPVTPAAGPAIAAPRPVAVTPVAVQATAP